MHSKTIILYVVDRQWRCQQAASSIPMRRLTEVLKSAKVAFRSVFETLENYGSPFICFYNRRTALVDVYCASLSRSSNNKIWDFLRIFQHRSDKKYHWAGDTAKMVIAHCEIRKQLLLKKTGSGTKNTQDRV
jgi:hypothetical protein